MSADFYNPDGIWQPFGAFSMAAIQGQGQVVHLKGQVALNAAGEVVGVGNMAAQVEQCLKNIRSALGSLGGRMEDVFSAVHYTTDIEQFMQCSEVRTRYFTQPYPVTTTVEVARLYRRELLIEITCSAEIPLDRFVSPAHSASDAKPT